MITIIRNVDSYHTGDSRWMTFVTHSGRSMSLLCSFKRPGMHDQSVLQIAAMLESDAPRGLSSEDASRRTKKYGLNEIRQAKNIPIFHLIIRQFKSPIVFLLLIAASLSFAYSKWSDGLAVLIVLFINTCVGFYMEFKAERSMNALRKLTKTFSKVIRNGTLTEVATSEIVPGDLLYVEAGDIISADARICTAYQLQVDESAMTGESIPSEKTEGVLHAKTLLADRTNMLYKGTFVTRGNAKALVVATGMETELGKIAWLVQRSDDPTTPIEKKLEQFSKRLISITLLIGLAIFIMGIVNGKTTFDMLNTVIALCVAAIPEGLPIVATLALAHGMLKMAKQNVIVKKLASVETLGGTNIICTDKTGTLTHNRIRVSHIATEDFNSLHDRHKTQSAQWILQNFVLCSNANVSGTDTSNEVGDPLEVGLLHFAIDQHIDVKKLREEFPKVAEEPFKSETKVMATLHTQPLTNLLFAKGAAESIIQMCSRYLDGNIEKPFTPVEKNKWLLRSEEEASAGLKVMAFAIKQNIPTNSEIDLSGLTFLGIASLIDPPRSDVHESIRLCHHAGIHIVMITGDHPSTAKNIASQIGIISNSNEKVIQGMSMPLPAELSKEQRAEWKSASVFARVSPSQKLDLIQVLQEDHSIVAMTGDGVNDAPALKKADIGIAMGLRGTDVAKEVADMVLKDDSFPSIVSAIKEGRIIFENIRKFLMFLLSSNLSEILVIASLFITNAPLAISPIQILFINLLSDVFPALALGFSSGSETIMHRPPRNPKKPILNNLQWTSVIVYAVIIAASTFSTTIFMISEGSDEKELLRASTVLFYTLIFAQLLHVFNVGDHRQPFFKTDIFRNVYVWSGVSISIIIAILAYFILPFRNVLNLGELNLKSTIVILGCGLQSFVFIQILKRFHLIH